MPRPGSSDTDWCPLSGNQFLRRSPEHRRDQPLADGSREDANAVPKNSAPEGWTGLAIFATLTANT